MQINIEQLEDADEGVLAHLRQRAELFLHGTALEHVFDRFNIERASHFDAFAYIPEEDRAFWLTTGVELRTLWIEYTRALYVQTERRCYVTMVIRPTYTVRDNPPGYITVEVSNYETTLYMCMHWRADIESAYFTATPGLREPAGAVGIDIARITTRAERSIRQDF